MPDTPETAEDFSHTPSDNTFQLLRDTLRNVQAVATASPDPTPIHPEKEAAERFRLYRLCPCAGCGGTGRTIELGAFASAMDAKAKRCKACRGEGRTLDLVATCGTKEAVGVALVTLAQEAEWDECPFGLMDRPQGHTGRWLIKPWGPSPRNVSDAGRLLRAQR